MAEQIRKRNEIDAKYKWDLTHIYPDDAAWEKAYDEAMKSVAALAALICSMMVILHRQWTKIFNRVILSGGLSRDSQARYGGGLENRWASPSGVRISLSAPFILCDSTAIPPFPSLTPIIH